MRKLKWIAVHQKTMYGFGRWHLKQEDKLIASVVVPCWVTFFQWELYTPNLLEDIERFETLADLNKRLKELGLPELKT